MNRFFGRSLSPIFLRVCVSAQVLLLFGVSFAAADLIKLNSGGELRGKIVKSRTNRESVTLETLSGVEVTVSRDVIQFITPRSLSVEEYESELKKLPSTVEAHWEMAKWCKQKALIKERETHLRKVIELDPNHKDARRQLGHVQTKDGWVNRDELMERQGYVKYRGKYITPQELDQFEKTTAERKEEKRWYQKVKLWKGWVRNGFELGIQKSREGWVSLESINDPHAIPAVMHHLGEDEQRELRQLAVKVLTHIGGDKPIPGLVQISLKDSDVDVRYDAAHALSPDQFKLAIPIYVRELRSPSNLVVRRSAAVLGKIGGEQVIDPLIHSLITTHTYQVRVPGAAQPTYSFSTNGSFASPTTLPPEIMARLAAGQFPNGVVVLDNGLTPDSAKYRLVDVSVNQQNEEVLSALQKLTGKNFGYDQRTWHLWWSAEKNHGDTEAFKS